MNFLSKMTNLLVNIDKYRSNPRNIKHLQNVARLRRQIQLKMQFLREYKLKYFPHVEVLSPQNTPTHGVVKTTTSEMPTQTNIVPASFAPILPPVLDEMSYSEMYSGPDETTFAVPTTSSPRPSVSFHPASVGMSTAREYDTMTESSFGFAKPPPPPAHKKRLSKIVKMPPIVYASDKTFLEMVGDDNNLTGTSLNAMLLELDANSLEKLDQSKYGIRPVGEKLALGNSQVEISNGSIKILDKEELAQELDIPDTYTLTEGLLELLLLREPKNYSKVDVQNYFNISRLCNLFSSTRSGHIYRDVFKYNIIRPHIEVEKQSRLRNTYASSQKGQGLIFKRYTSKKSVFNYYNNPNRLVNRLRVLVAAKHAGNDNVDFEIRSIEAELRNHGIIS